MTMRVARQPRWRGVWVWAGAALLTASLGAAGVGVDEIHMLTGRSVVLEHPDDIVRISVANPEVIDAVAVTTREVLLNAKASGATSLVIWSKPGDRQMFTVYVTVNAEALERQMKETFPAEQIQVRGGKDALTLTGRVSSPAVAERAAALAATAAKTVINNLEIAPPAADQQILLRVRFAEVNRVAITQYGVNLLSTGALNTPGSISTQQFSPPTARIAGDTTTFTFSDVLNVFAFRPDLNLALMLRALQSRNLLEILAEPNLVTSNGKEATFLAGGEFPFPVVQGGGNASAVTIQFREFGVRVSFTPLLTAHNTIRMHVRPEVSSLDFANALVISGFTVPAISTRRVDADVELALGQSFAIAGMLDSRVTENLQKIPGLASIPLLGNLFKSRTATKANSELLVLVTPEIAGPEAKIEPAAVAFSERLLAPAVTIGGGKRVEPDRKR
jgi:pilus assembly protein CpaC